MTPERWQRVVELFEAALGWPPEERETRLGERCAGDGKLYDLVVRMLEADRAERSAPDGSPGEGPPQAPPPPAALPPDAALGRYRLRERIGSGGFSEVYRAWDPELGRQVAIKTSRSQRPDLQRRFAREAKIVARLVHPNITVVHDSGVEGDTAFLVQELLDGRDLRRVIDEEGPAPLATRLRWLLEIARGLEHAHGHGVVHRDIKPSNLRVCDDGRVKILDFGVAALLGEVTRLTVDGSLVGTAAYMAPEQVRGDEIDTRADLYSFAAVAYELLCGEPVHRADSLAGLLYQIVHAEPEPLAPRLPDDLTPEVGRMIERCLDKRPERRPEGFAPVIAVLESALTAAELPPSEGRPPASRLGGGEAAKGGSGRGWIVAAAGLAAALVAVALGLGVWRSVSQPPAGAPAAAEPTATGSTATGPTATGPDAAAGAVTAALGTLVVDARPWAEVTAIQDAAGRRLPPPSPPFTPLVLPLPAGEYTVTMAYPGVAGDRRCTAVVEPAAASRCSARFVTVAAAEYLGPRLPAGSAATGSGDGETSPR